MSFVGLWVYDGAAPYNVVYSRRFPTVERRARLSQGTAHVPLPPESTWCDDVVAAVTGVRRDGSLQPSTGRAQDWPLLSVGHPAHYPVVVLVDRGLIFVAYPLTSPDSTVAALVMPHLHLLHEVAKIVHNSRAVGRTFATISLELHNYVSVTAPLGTALNTPVTYAAHLLGGRGGGAPAAPALGAKVAADKVPAWKPGGPKGKSGVVFTVDEQIRVAQYDKPATPDVCEYYGTLLCTAEVEGVADLGVTITAKAHLCNVVTHPCVQHLEQTAANTYRLLFSPPVGIVKLISYQIAAEPVVPVIRGFYQMKQIAPDTVKLLLQLKLDIAVNNQFSFCEARIPLTGFPPILRFDSTPAVGTVQVDDGHTLVWKIGKMFPKRNLEVALPASVIFSSDASGKAPAAQPSPAPGSSGGVTTLGGVPVDPFLSGNTSHALVVFKVTEYCHSGLQVDNVQAIPSAKLKTSTVHELSSSSYVVWNSMGKSRSCPSWAADPVTDGAEQHNGVSDEPSSS